VTGGDRAYLLHILECIGWIRKDTRDGRDAFLANRTLRDAVLRNLQVMAESTQRLSAERKARYPEVQRSALAGFRNVLVHAYLGIRHELVWRFIERDLAVLERTIQTMLADFEAGGA
jgi:uncharacterized protein with HEPN domain